jgi:hypothetical protein
MSTETSCPLTTLVRALSENIDYKPTPEEMGVYALIDDTPSDVSFCIDACECDDEEIFRESWAQLTHTDRINVLASIYSQYNDYGEIYIRSKYIIDVIVQFEKETMKEGESPFLSNYFSEMQ